MSTKYRTDSVYKNTKIINNKYLGVYQSTVGDISNTETSTIKLTSKYHQRPDVLAHDLYGNAKLWWVFAEFNQDTLVDPIIDFTNGKTIVYPVRFA